MIALKHTLPVCLQAERAECGLACLSMVLGYYGHPTPLMALRRRFQISSNGLTLASLMDIAVSLNLTPRSFRLELSALKGLRLPCILHWNMNHFVVLKAVHDDGITIHDPAKGVVRLSMSEVDKLFTGVALELTPGLGFVERKPAPRFTLSDLWQTIVGLKRAFAKIIILSLLIQLFVLAAPYYLQTVIDRVIPTRDENLLLILAFGFLLVLVFQQVVSVLRAFVVMYMGAAFGTQVSGSLFRHMLSLPLAFFEKRDIGDIVTRFESLNRIREFLANSFVETIIDGVMALAVLSILFYYDPAITFVVLGFVIAYAVFRVAQLRAFRRAIEAEAISRGRERSNFIETVQNIQTIMLFDAQAQRSGQWNNLYADNINSALGVQKARLLYQVGNATIFGLENIIVLYLLALGVLRAELTIGMLTAYVAYKATFARSFSAFLDKLMEYKVLDLHLERISEIALAEPVRDIHQTDAQPIRGEIELVNVSYRHDDFSTPIFQDVNLKIAPGDHIAITGASGVGKSTLGKMLLGLLEPSSGVILVDRRPIESYGKRNFRKHVAAVMQDDRLYAGSILDNICLFAAQPDIELAHECAKLAQIDYLVRGKPMGYNSLLGQGGSSLSGGERQRLFLARALYKRPSILLMDEASSHLDVKTEMAINEAISALRMTRIIIAHRPQTIRNARRVLRLTRNGLAELAVSELQRAPA